LKTSSKIKPIRKGKSILFDGRDSQPKEDDPQETQKGINSKQTKYNLPTYLTYGTKKNKKPPDP
jgi:hypothetical protein